MKSMNTSFQQMLASVPSNIQQEVDLEMALSNRISDLMTERGLSKLEFAKALGKRPSEVTKWLSGQHNFTIRTISLLSAYFGKSIIHVEWIIGTKQIAFLLTNADWRKAQHRFAPFRIHHSSFHILKDPQPLQILLNRPNPANAEVFDQDFGHIGRKESRQSRAKVDVLHTEAEQG